MATISQTISAASTNGTTATFSLGIDLSLSGTFTGLVYLDRSFDAGSTWHILKSYLEPVEEFVQVTTSALYRFRTDQYFTGAVVIYAVENGGIPVSIAGGSVTITGPVTMPASVEIANDAGNAIPVAVNSRVCLGTQMITGLSTVTAASLTVPTNSIAADIQADGGTVRIRHDGIAPTAIRGWRLDDGMALTVDSNLTNIRLLAVAGVATNVQIVYFDRV